MKVFNVIFVVLFIISAALQYNDPDPYIWVPLYLYGAWLCYKAFKDQYDSRLYWVGMAVYLGYAIFLFFDKTGVLNWAGEHDAENIAQSMKVTKPWIEETREFFGLLILVGVLLTNMLAMSRTKKGS